MKFIRGVDPRSTMGIGEFGKRGLVWNDPYIQRGVYVLHVKKLAWAIEGWYQKIGREVSIFHFPCKEETNRPKYVITAAPGEETHYHSKYRKIEYPEIISTFWELAENPNFRSWLYDVNIKMSEFLKLHTP